MSAFFGKKPENFLGNPFSGLLNLSPAAPSPQTTAEFFQPAFPSSSLLSYLLSPYRTRSEWNERFAHWERSETNSETQRIERARDMVIAALSRNEWLKSDQVKFEPQGSFTNRTNTRLEADIDLRVQHPALKVDYDPDVAADVANSSMGYTGLGITLDSLNRTLRSEIERELVSQFGRGAVTPGKKAIRVQGLTGSRAEVDVVPAFTFHKIGLASTTQWPFYQYSRQEGAAILSLDNKWTINYPQQHIINGRVKRITTQLRFKRIVRTIKRLRSEMAELHIFNGNVPSFLIECLVYLVEDDYFLVPTDDRYDRSKRILFRIFELLENPFFPYGTLEINGIKTLFGSEQSWSIEDARAFVKAAISRLGNA